MMDAHAQRVRDTVEKLAGNCMRFWDRMQEFFEEGCSELDDGKRKDKKKPQEKPERQPVKCPKCFAVHLPSPMCHACGYEYPKKRATVAHIAGELAELTGTVKPGEERQARLGISQVPRTHRRYTNGIA